MALPLSLDTDADNTALPSPPTADNAGLSGTAAGVAEASSLSALLPDTVHGPHFECVFGAVGETGDSVGHRMCRCRRCRSMNRNRNHRTSADTATSLWRCRCCSTGDRPPTTPAFTATLCHCRCHRTPPTNRCCQHTGLAYQGGGAEASLFALLPAVHRPHYERVFGAVGETGHRIGHRDVAHIVRNHWPSADTAT